MNRSIKMWLLCRQYQQYALKKNMRYIAAQNLTVCHKVWFCQSSNREVELTTDTCSDMNSLTNSEKTLEKKLKVLELEVDVWRQEGIQVPSHLETEDWKELLALESRSGRRKFLAYCWKKEMVKRSFKKKKEEGKLKRLEYLESKKDLPNDPLHYGLGGNSLFMRVRESTMDNFFNGKLIEAMQFNQKLVIDCGYEDDMSPREAKNCGKQLMILFGDNRLHVSPFNLYFCNAKRGIGSMKAFEKSVRTAYEPYFPLNITEQSYLDIFPKEKLVYLTPHCREELLNYDHDAVYIIGAMVDKAHSQPLSLAKAKEQGLKMAKLPLDRYLNWNAGGGKSLTLNQMILILLDMKLTGDWKKALKHVPTRKIQSVFQVDRSDRRFKLVGGSLQKNNSNISYNEMISRKKR